MEDSKLNNYRSFNIQGFQLNLKEYICCTLCTHLAFSHFIRHLNLIQKYGVLMLVPVHILNIFIFSIPIFSFQTFVGVYTRKSYVKFWDIMPVLKGVSYCLFVNIMYNVAMNVAYGVQALIMALNFLRVKLPSTHCKFQGATNACAPITIKTEYNNTCCVGLAPVECPTMYKFSSYEYYKKFMYGDPENTNLHYSSDVQWDWIFSVTFTYIVVFWFLYFDFRRYRHIAMYFISFCGLLVIPFTIIGLFISVDYGRPRNLDSNVKLTDPEFWIEAYIHAAYWERPGEFIYYGSLASAFRPTAAALFVYSIKITFLSICAVWYSVATHMLQDHYRILDVMCINFKGRDLFFAAIPDMLAKLWFPQMWLMLWFILIFLWCLTQSTLLMTINVHSMSENFSTMRSHRVLFCFFYIIFQSLPCFLLLNKTYRTYFQAWRQSGYFIYTLCFLASEVIALAVYSIQRISNDYHFKYGHKINAYCVYSWKISIFYTLMIFIIFCVHFRDIKVIRSLKGKNKIILHSITGVLISPIFIYAIGRIIYYKIKPVRMLTPQQTWGSPDPNEQLQRINFYPQKRTRYSQEQVRCKHNCLRISDKLADEMFLMEQKKLYLERALEETRDSHHHKQSVEHSIVISVKDKQKRKKKQKLTLKE